MADSAIRVTATNIERLENSIKSISEDRASAYEKCKKDPILLDDLRDLKNHMKDKHQEIVDDYKKIGNFASKKTFILIEWYSNQNDFITGKNSKSNLCENKLMAPKVINNLNKEIHDSLEKDKRENSILKLIGLQLMSSLNQGRHNQQYDIKNFTPEEIKKYVSPLSSAARTGPTW